MPTYNQASWIQRAIESLLDQSLADWELLIVNDGARDETIELVSPYLRDRRVQLHNFLMNRGLGAALNFGLEHCTAAIVAYLPSDDLYFRNHLASLDECLRAHPEAVLAFSGLRHHYNKSVPGCLPRRHLQLVQTAHRLGSERWLERRELVTDDLDRMFWHKLRSRGEFAATGTVSCEWVDHPLQRHKLLREPLGGINAYRQHFHVTHPLRFHSSAGNSIDEARLYHAFRWREPAAPAADGLKIVLAGELAYNPERVLALEERGHKLYGLWMPEPHWYNSVGPLPFGHVEDLPQRGWKEALRKLKPDIIYGLLNWQAVPFARDVLLNSAGIPFIWHFKEGPMICLEKGLWSELIELYRYADGLIYSNPEMRRWFETIVPGCNDEKLTLLLDGDLPKREWFSGSRHPKLSASSGDIHTVVPGRPIGLHPETVQELAARRIHLHFYGDFTHGQWREWIEKTSGMAGDYLHLHPQIDQDQWVSEFSRYDAGWLHVFRSDNQGEIRRATWDDLNYPARIATLASAGLPLIQYDNTGSIVASRELTGALGIGLFFEDFDDLQAKLYDSAALAEQQRRVWDVRMQFTFDQHVDRLIEFFRAVIDGADFSYRSAVGA